MEVKELKIDNIKQEGWFEVLPNSNFDFGKFVEELMKVPIIDCDCKLFELDRYDEKCDCAISRYNNVYKKYANLENTDEKFYNDKEIEVKIIIKNRDDNGTSGTFWMQMDVDDNDICDIYIIFRELILSKLNVGMIM